MFLFVKKILFTLAATIICMASNAQFKIYQSGHISLQSTTIEGGVQIKEDGRSSFEPNIISSETSLTQTKVQSNLVRAWTVRYSGNPAVSPDCRFYETGLGDAYAHGHYTISSGGGDEPSKGNYPIENAAGILSSLNGYYYDNNDFNGFKPDFVNNPNIAPEAIDGMMKDLSIDKALGLSVDDLEEVLPEAIRHDPEGMVYINYSAIIPVLVEAFKEQQQIIDLLQKEIDELKTNTKGYSETRDGEAYKSVLYQNMPNPTNASTIIECFIESYPQKSIIAVYDLNGLQLKEYPVDHQGKNIVTIEADEFKPGIYMYSLLVDGKLIDTKRMVITSK